MCEVRGNHNLPVHIVHPPEVVLVQLELGVDRVTCVVSNAEQAWQQGLGRGVAESEERVNMFLPGELGEAKSCHALQSGQAVNVHAGHIADKGKDGVYQFLTTGDSAARTLVEECVDDLHQDFDVKHLIVIPRDEGAVHCSQPPIQLCLRDVCNSTYNTSAL